MSTVILHEPALINSDDKLGADKPQAAGQEMTAAAKPRILGLASKFGGAKEHKSVRERSSSHPVENFDSKSKKTPNLGKALEYTQISEKGTAVEYPRLFSKKCTGSLIEQQSSYPAKPVFGGENKIFVIVKLSKKLRLPEQICNAIKNTNNVYWAVQTAKAGDSFLGELLINTNSIARGSEGELKATVEVFTDDPKLNVRGARMTILGTTNTPADSKADGDTPTTFKCSRDSNNELHVGSSSIILDKMPSYTSQIWILITPTKGDSVLIYFWLVPHRIEKSLFNDETAIMNAVADVHNKPSLSTLFKSFDQQKGANSNNPENEPSYLGTPLTTVQRMCKMPKLRQKRSVAAIISAESTRERHQSATSASIGNVPIPTPLTEASGRASAAISGFIDIEKRKLAEEAAVGKPETRQRKNVNEKLKLFENKANAEESEATEGVAAAASDNNSLQVPSAAPGNVSSGIKLRFVEKEPQRSRTQSVGINDAPEKRPLIFTPGLSQKPTPAGSLTPTPAKFAISGAEPKSKPRSASSVTPAPAKSVAIVGVKPTEADKTKIVITGPAECASAVKPPKKS